jgi:two-component system chemotaxis response regulator CheB
MLADRLASHSAIPIEEGVADATLVPGSAWLAPGNFHMVVKRAGVSCRLALNQEPAENSCRPAVDVLFRSVASVFGANTLAVVMTGMGCDGLIGARKICDAGGQIIVQDEASSIVWGMPGAIYQSGIADAAYPLSQLAGEITRRVFESRDPAQASPKTAPAGSMNAINLLK